jgi:ribosomal protein L32
MLRSLILGFETLAWRLSSRPGSRSLQPALCGLPIAPLNHHQHKDNDLSLWFAVPKKKVSHSRKRMKQNHKNRMPHKQNIITCPRTGELTLMHKLPLNWRDYIPTFDYEPITSTSVDEDKK